MPPTPTNTGEFRFTKNSRLLKSVDFRKVYDNGSRFSCPYFVAFLFRPSATNRDDGPRIGFVSSSSLTLAQKGAVLATSGAVPGAKITRALNLDGGSSTGLWVASDPPFDRRELRNVRDFIGIVPR